MDLAFAPSTEMATALKGLLRSASLTPTPTGTLCRGGGISTAVMRVRKSSEAVKPFGRNLAISREAGLRGVGDISGPEEKGTP